MECSIALPAKNVMTCHHVLQYNAGMKIAVDVREACAAQPTGKGRWTRCCVQELLAREHELTLYTNSPLPDEWKPLLKPRHAVVRIPYRGLRWHLAVALHVRRRRYDWYFSPVSFIVPLLLPRRMGLVVVVHDLISFLHEAHDARARRIERATLWLLLRKNVLILTVSRQTKSDLLHRFPAFPSDRAIPIFAGITTVPSVARQEDASLILCVSTLCPRKNQLRLIQAYAALPAQLRERYSLVLVGKRGWHDQDIVDAAAREEGIRWLSYMDDAALASLYARTAVVAYPSLYEGFGLPVLEAMQSGIPVLTSAEGSLREIAQDAALLVDPRDVHSIATGLQNVLEDQALRESLIQKGKQRAMHYSWKKTVDVLLHSLCTFETSSQQSIPDFTSS